MVQEICLDLSFKYIYIYSTLYIYIYDTLCGIYWSIFTLHTEYFIILDLQNCLYKDG